jgi:parallel beta-helix repeat protein
VGAAAVCALGTSLLLAPPVGAGKDKRKIEVDPGPNAIGKALDRADDGDVLRIHRGRYEEALGIEKRVRLVAAGKRRPVIDGECLTRSTVEALADGVRLRRLKVVGGLAIEIDFRGVSGGRADQLVVRDTCDAAYGINVYETGPVKIRNSRAVGFNDAGFYAGEIAAGPVVLRDSEAHGNNRGVIIENSAPAAGAVNVRVRDSFFHDNNIPGRSGPAGILIHNSDGVRLKDNRATDNGTFGIHLTSDSNGNAVLDSSFLGNPFDIRNQGAGNCGSGNESQTGDTLPPC